MVRLLTHLVMNDTPITHVIYLLHVLPAAASSNHARTVYFRQLQSGLAGVSDEADVVRVVLASQV